MAYLLGSLLGTVFLVVIFLLGGWSIIKKGRENGSTGYKVDCYTLYSLFVPASLRLIEEPQTWHYLVIQRGMGRVGSLQPEHFVLLKGRLNYGRE